MTVSPVIIAVQNDVEQSHNTANPASAPTLSKLKLTAINHPVDNKSISICQSAILSPRTPS